MQGVDVWHAALNHPVLTSAHAEGTMLVVAGSPENKCPQGEHQRYSQDKMHGLSNSFLYKLCIALNFGPKLFFWPKTLAQNRATCFPKYQ